MMKRIMTNIINIYIYNNIFSYLGFTPCLVVWGRREGQGAGRRAGGGGSGVCQRQ